jgi:transcriptional regulator of met regulon
MKHASLLFLLTFLFGLTACSKPADPTLMNYEQSLVRADSLVQSGATDSARIVRLLSGLHREYNQVKEHSGGSLVRIKPADKRKQYLWGAFTALMIGLNVWLSIKDIQFSKDRKHRRYLVNLSENEQRLRNNEQEKNELQECLKEMSLTDEEREEVQRSLMNLMEHGNHLCEENASLRARLKDYENRPVPREAELLKERNERISLLDSQVQALTSTLIDRDDVVERLRRQPKFLSDKDWEHLTQLANRVYSDFTNRLATRFPSLTAADLQLCLLIRLRFTNAQVATLIAVSPASVSQQKFRLKKRLMQEEETLFKDGETVDGFVWGY